MYLQNRPTVRTVDGTLNKKNPTVLFLQYVYMYSFTYTVYCSSSDQKSPTYQIVLITM